MFFETLTRVNEPHCQLYCFPYGGVGASVFKKWTKYLDPDIELIGIQMPGRETKIKEPPFLQMKPLVKALANCMPRKPRLPYAFYGHSLGALIAFELTVELQMAGYQGPNHLIVSGCRAPHIHNQRKPINQLPDDQFIEAIRKLGGTPEEVLQNEILMEVFLPILRSDFTLFENYVYEEKLPLEIPILAFSGIEDQEVGKDDLLAWKTYTKKEFKPKFFPGNHFFLENQYQQLIASFLPVLGTY